VIEYPYMMSNNKISKIINSLQTAEKPNKLTQKHLTNLGYTSTNDRAIIQLLKRLGFLTDDGSPSSQFDQLRDKALYKKTLASCVRELYKDLFAINTEIYKDSDENIKGAISRVTGGDEESVKRIYATFKTLCNIADFSQPTVKEAPVKATTKENIPEQSNNIIKPIESEFHYNIQIHLPATTDISVYNAIFKSLKDNLFI